MTVDSHLFFFYPGLNLAFGIVKVVLDVVGLVCQVPGVPREFCPMRNKYQFTCRVFKNYCSIGCRSLLRSQGNSEFGVLLSFGVSNYFCLHYLERDNKRNVIFASTPFYNLLSFKAFLKFVLKLLIEKGNTVFVQ